MIGVDCIDRDAVLHAQPGILMVVGRVHHPVYLPALAPYITEGIHEVRLPEGPRGRRSASSQRIFCVPAAAAAPCPRTEHEHIWGGEIYGTSVCLECGCASRIRPLGVVAGPAVPAATGALEGTAVTSPRIGPSDDELATQRRLALLRVVLGESHQRFLTGEIVPECAVDRERGLWVDLAEMLLEGAIPQLAPAAWREWLAGGDGPPNEHWREAMRTWPAIDRPLYLDARVVALALRRGEQPRSRLTELLGAIHRAAGDASVLVLLPPDDVLLRQCCYPWVLAG